MVELLLRYGADPFTENPAGKTPLDLALEARAVNILRACERQALFAGYVSTRVSAPGLLYKLPSCCVVLRHEGRSVWCDFWQGSESASGIRHRLWDKACVSHISFTSAAAPCMCTCSFCFLLCAF